HPDVTSGYIYGGESTRVVLTVCLVLVAVFAFFFVLYSSGAFLRARNREFGLLTLMGTTRGQLRRLIWLENLILSVAAIMVGIGLGQLFSKLFLMGISRVLGLEATIRFMFVPNAALLTAVAFLVLFQVVSLVSTARIGGQDVVELMRAARRPRAVPRASLWLALLGALLVVAGYVVALNVDQNGVVVAFVPVVATVVVGTFLLFGHGSVKLLELFRRAETRYLHGTRMLVVSQLLFRARDNARLLATIATLSAVVLAAAGAFYIFTRQLAETTALAFPQAITFVERVEGAGPLTSPDQGEPLTHQVIDARFAEHGVTPTLRSATEVHELRYRRSGAAGTSWLTLVSESEYQALARSGGFDANERGSPTLIALDGGELVLGAAAGAEAWPVTPDVSLPVVVLSDWYVMADADLAAIPVEGREYQPAELWLYDWPSSDRYDALGVDLYELMVAASSVDASGSLVVNRMVREVFGLSMFAGLFVSLLFFIGAGSLIYFKLFTELEGDRRLFGRLRRLGITPAETRRTVTLQIAMIFLLPFAVGGLHAVVALGALGTLVMANVVQYTLIVIGLFALVQTGFFLLTRWTYLRALRPAR
ncbi:MAG: ABC transporter permease, partial [Trueperaceae bacterium]